MRKIGLLSLIAFILYSYPADRGSGPTFPNMIGFTFIEALDARGYYLSDNKTTWTDAKARCASAGGHLVTISSMMENDVVVDALGLEDGWIGLTDEDNEGTFAWVNGAPVTFENWDVGKPNDQDGNDDYVIIHGKSHPNPGS